MKKNVFKIIIPVYNAENYIKQCIDSIKMQEYTDYRAVIINDLSTDNTANIIETEIKDDPRFTFINNSIKKCALENTIVGIREICDNDEDIVVIVDGDDWLPNKTVLTRLNAVYQEDIWITWGQFELLSTKEICKFGDDLWCGEIVDDFKRHEMNRFYFSHLRTYKYFLFKQIREQDLRDEEGNYYTTAGDVVVALPMIEMAGKQHRKCIKQLMYTYNNLSSLNDMKVCPDKQVEIYNKIKQKPRYSPYLQGDLVMDYNPNVDILIWTKDRACQSDLLLRSIKDNLTNYNKIYLRYDYSDNNYKDGYQKLMNTDYGMDISFIERTDFAEDTRSIINRMESPHMVALCDDDVFTSPTELVHIMRYYSEDVAAISMRMGTNITYCYGTQKESPLPEFVDCKGNFLKWEWAKSDPTTDWGYPGAVNIHIYKTQWYRDMIKNAKFNNPNELEYIFNTNRNKFAKYLLSFKQPRILNIPINQVQTVCPSNPFGKNYRYDRIELNNWWLLGYRIKTSNIYGYTSRGVNEELPLFFERG